MPRQVDHDERRRAVAEIAIKLIARGGLDGLTIRDVAKAAGYSTAIVSHYFKDKRQLLLFIYRAAIERAQRQIEAALAKDRGDLNACLDAILPLDEQRRHDWLVWFAFWGMAIADAEFAAEQRQRLEDAKDVLQAVFKARQESGRSIGGTDSDLQARRCVTLVDGLAVQAVFAPDQWPPERQRAFVLEALGMASEAR